MTVARHWAHLLGDHGRPPLCDHGLVATSSRINVARPSFSFLRVSSLAHAYVPSGTHRHQPFILPVDCRCAVQLSVFSHVLRTKRDQSHGIQHGSMRVCRFCVVPASVVEDLHGVVISTRRFFLHISTSTVSEKSELKIHKIVLNYEYL